MQNHLRELRKGRGLAMWGLATSARVSTSTLTAIEKWGYYPSAETRQKIATALSVTEQEIWEAQN